MEQPGTLGEWEEVLVLSQWGKQPQYEDLGGLQGYRVDLKVADHIQLHLGPGAVGIVRVDETRSGGGAERGARGPTRG